MVRIAGVNLPNKRTVFALPYIYGVGLPLARKICQAIGINEMKKIEELTSAEVNKIEKFLEAKIEVEGELKRKIQANIKRLVEIGCYRGVRHQRKLPVWGQRTRTNARTRKGPKKTVSSGKRKLTKK